MTDLPVNLRHLEGRDNRKVEIVVVVPVARCEWHLAMKLLAWMDALRDSPEIIVYCAPGVQESERAALGGVTNCTVVHATHFKDTGYFGGANNMVKGALDWMEENRAGKAMLYLEADAVPMRSGWFDEILDEYRWSGAFFMGDLHLCALDHLTGNAVYAPDWRRIAPSLAALPGPDPEWGWDSSCAQDTLTRAHRAKTIQQIWRPPLPITAQWAAANIRPETALFHQCKDSSLIDVLCLQHGLPLIPLPAQLEPSTYSKGRQTPEDPALVARLSPQQRVIVGLPTEVCAGIEILIVTYRKDMEFLRYALKSIEKYASGFLGVTVVVPEQERGLYNWVKKAKVHYFNEREGKGGLHHLVQKCRADEICPTAEAILIMDADCMFWKRTTPADYIVNGKLLMVRERYADLRNPNRKYWQTCVEKAMGFKPEYETMTRHPLVLWREVFSVVRKETEKHTGREFDEYVLDGSNSFPFHFAELDSLGAIALRDFRHRYHCVDYDWKKDCRELGIPETAEFQYVYVKARDHMVEVWSHAGLDRYKSDMDAWLRGQVPAYFLK